MRSSRLKICQQLARVVEGNQAVLKKQKQKNKNQNKPPKPPLFQMQLGYGLKTILLHA